MKLLFIISLFLSVSVNSYAKSTVIKANTYSDIQKIFDQKTKQYKPEELLFVFDIDHTLILMDDCLNQEDNIKKRNKFNEKVKQCDSYLTSMQLPNVLMELKNSKYPVMALTARFDFEYTVNKEKSQKRFIYEDTIDQLQSRLRTTQSPNSEKATLSFETAPSFSEHRDILEFDYFQKRKKAYKWTSRPYVEGILFAGGLNKGQVLQAFTEAYELHYKEIVFIDDNKDYVRHMSEEYQETDNHVTVIHYLEHAK